MAALVRLLGSLAALCLTAEAFQAELTTATLNLLPQEDLDDPSARSSIQSAPEAAAARPSGNVSGANAQQLQQQRQLRAGRLSAGADAAATAAGAAVGAGAASAGALRSALKLVDAQAPLCRDGDGPCKAEAIHVVMLLLFLTISVISVIVTFSFFRDDKEEHITPLCPQLVTRDSELALRFPLGGVATPPNALSMPAVEGTQVSDELGRCICKLSTDWPDPFNHGISGVAATMRLQNPFDATLANVIIRHVAVVNQGLALCRSSYEVFGFVEPEGSRRYNIRHRTGVVLLSLVGDFDTIDVEGLNPVGVKVCWFKQVSNQCHGNVLQHVDAGLVLCGLMATRLHRRILAREQTPDRPHLRSLSPVSEDSSYDEAEAAAAGTASASEAVGAVPRSDTPPLQAIE
eukprot:TRINITY_DN72070_c0_g1_i1.p1 TRINITY_DN72070_c0_g1~~TRINITY_DN72070_c0_g1_i1.p1  ORF type:complete len:404 (+),score=102.64 TRINITY_DN72070_c0_g1_i1:114-1325(+)